MLHLFNLGLSSHVHLSTRRIRPPHPAGLIGVPASIPPPFNTSDSVPCSGLVA